MSTAVEPAWSPKFQSLSSRGWILASFYTAIILALPFWLKTTTIERLPLPRHDVVTWEAQLPCPVRLHQSLTLLVPPGVIQTADRFAIAERIQRSLTAAGDGIVEQRKPKKHYVDGQGGQEAVVFDDEKTDQAKPLQYAACIDWDVRVGGKDEHRSVAGLREFYISLDPANVDCLDDNFLLLTDYEVDFLTKNEVASTMSSTSTTRRMQLPLPDRLTPNHNYGIEESSSILSSYLARLLQLPYTPLFFPFDSSVPTLEESDVYVKLNDDVKTQIEKREEDRRRVPFTRNLRLVFSLINEEISAQPVDSAYSGRKRTTGVRGWDRAQVNGLFKNRFTPLLQALQTTQTFYTELQTTWFAPLQFEPKMLQVKGEVVETLLLDEDAPLTEENDDTIDSEAITEEREVNELIPLKQENTMDRYHLIDWEDIKIFVNSGEWSLTSGAVTLPLSSSLNASAVNDKKEQDMSSLFEQNERTLHFILYIPKPSHRPLRIAGNEQATILSEAKGWLIPQWGGVSLFNLGYEEGESEEKSESSHILDSLSAVELDAAFSTFERQFSTLVGLQELDIVNIEKEISLALRLDSLTRKRIIAASRESVSTLASTIRLIDKIENLGVGQSVRDDVSRALLLLDEVSALLVSSQHLVN